VSENLWGFGTVQRVWLNGDDNRAIGVLVKVSAANSTELGTYKYFTSSGIWRLGHLINGDGSSVMKNCCTH
jgi:hypothetical protein